MSIATGRAPTGLKSEGRPRRRSVPRASPHGASPDRSAAARVTLRRRWTSAGSRLPTFAVPPTGRAVRHASRRRRARSLGRRRLIAISSRPTSRRRAPTRSSATSGGSSTRSSRCSSTWSSSSVIFDAGGPDYPLFIFAAILPWKWFTTSVRTRSRRSSGQERLIKQIQFPKIVLPVAAVIGRRRQLRVRADPAGRADRPVLPDRLSRALLLIPVDRRRPVRVHPGFGDRSSARSTCSSATSATSPATSCGCGSTSRRRCTALDQLRPARRSTPDRPLDPELNPFAILFDGVPDGHLRRRRPPDWSAPRARVAARRLAGPARPRDAALQAVEPSFAKVL